MSAKGSQTAADYIPFEEFKSFVSQLREDKEYKWEMYFTLSFTTGLRISDVLQIKWSDIIGKASYTTVEKKTGKSRVISFSQSTQDRFQELHKLMHIRDDKRLVMCTKSGNAIDTCNINKDLKKLRDKYSLSISNFSTHSMRKTFGRYVYESNNKSEEALILLSQIFNHSSLAITRRYLGITGDEIKSVYNGISL